MSRINIEWVSDPERGMARQLLVRIPFWVKPTSGGIDKMTHAACAARDMGLIIMFAKKMAFQNHGVDYGTYNKIVDPLKLQLTDTHAEIAGFIAAGEINEAVIDRVIATLKVEAIGNLPAGWLAGGKPASSEPVSIPVKRARKPARQLVLPGVSSGSNSFHKPPEGPLIIHVEFSALRG